MRHYRIDAFTARFHAAANDGLAGEVTRVRLGAVTAGRRNLARDLHCQLKTERVGQRGCQAGNPPLMSGWKLICALLGVGGLPAAAHDSNVIAAVAYIRPTQVQLVMEMTFPTGMILAGCKPSSDLTVERQFEAGQSPLRLFLGGLIEVTAGSRACLALRTNAELTLEQHIRGSVEFPATTNRPLRFIARGLRDAPESPYRVALSVLDLVNRKVLGQVVLAADSPPAVFPPVIPSLGPLVTVHTGKAEVVEKAIEVSAQSAASAPPAKSPWLMAGATLAAMAVLIVAWRFTQQRS